MTGAQFAELSEYDELVADDAVPRCPVCHGDPEVCGDPQRDWFAQKTVCYRDRAQKTARRMFEAVYGEDHQFHDGKGLKWAKEFSPATPTRYDDGVTISVTPTDESPGATFLEKRES